MTFTVYSNILESLPGVNDWKSDPGGEKDPVAFTPVGVATVVDPLLTVTGYDALKSAVRVVRYSVYFDISSKILQDIPFTSPLF